MLALKRMSAELKSVTAACKSSAEESHSVSPLKMVAAIFPLTELVITKKRLTDDSE
jgi:hypothetical protein